MTRYSVRVGSLWLAAVYDQSSNGIQLTPNKGDACSWVTYGKAVEAARIATAAYKTQAEIVCVWEPNYPQSWNLAMEAL
jgi:hypothetical protein